MSCGEGESLVVGKCSSASVKSQPCYRAHWTLPQTPGNRERQQEHALGGKLLVSAPLRGPEAGLDSALPPWSREAVA